MTANRLPKRDERITDRIGVIVYENWGQISVEEKTKKEKEVIQT